MAVDRDKVLQAAQKLVEKKRYDKAIIEYQRLVAEDPKDARTLLKIGDLYLKLEQYADAISTYERVGQFYSLQGFALKAIAVYKQIREIVHKHVPHLEDRFGHIVPRLAEIYTQLGLTSDALAAYDEVATRLQRAGRDRDAIDIFRKVVDLDPQNPLPYLRLAEAFVRVRDLDSAIQRFGAASDILLRLGRQDDALKVLERLLQHRPDVGFARTAADVYLARGQPNDAMSALAKLQICFKENPKDLETLGVLARAFDQLAQPSKAVEVMKEAARVALELNKHDVFRDLLAALRTRAPDDPIVAQLAAQAHSTRSTASALSREPVATIEEEEVDIVDIVEEPESEAPFVLRPSQHAPPLGYSSVHPPYGYPEQNAHDPATRARMALAQAEVLRRQRSYPQAASVLEQILADFPGAREVREKLCDILIEAGDQDGAIHHMLVFAQHLAALGDVDGAARMLDEVLLLEPGQPDALHTLAALGYLVPDAQDAQGATSGQESGGYDPEAPFPSYPEARAQTGGYDPEAPLPSYDLEEIGPAQAMSRQPPSLHSGDPASVGHLDDPFANEVPLPSFPMDEAPARYPLLTPVPPPETAILEAPPAPVSSPTPSRRASGEQLDEDALDEVEFFASHGMFDEARSMLDEQFARLPNHPLLLEKKHELDQLEAAVAQARMSVQPAEPSAVDADLDRSFDIAASLDQLDAMSPAPPGVTAGLAHDQQVSVESVFEQFKAGVAAQISQSDASTHYDLGVAYQEMGLLTDAIAEFELSSRDPARECVCQSMIGLIQLHLGDVDAAIDSFLRGLHAPQRTAEQELALTYEIGSAYELRSNREQALYYFQRVARIDPGYVDHRGSVADRIARLEPPKPAPARAVGAELVLDDFDAAFDDLLGNGS